MLAALMLTPILALFVMKGADFVAPVMAVPENYYNVLSGGGFNWKSISDILSGLGWGLGYFGMPHILVRYLSIKSEHEMRKSQIIGCSWILVILAMSAVVGVIGTMAHRMGASANIPYGLVDRICSGHHLDMVGAFT